MKLLLNQGLPRSTVQHLAVAGIVAEHVGDLGLARVADDMILATARERDAVVVTLDADFHQTLAATHASRHPWCGFALKIERRSSGRDSHSSSFDRERGTDSRCGRICHAGSNARSIFANWWIAYPAYGR